MMWWSLIWWKRWAIILAAFVAGVVGLRLKSLADGEARARAEMDQERQRAARKAREVEDEIEALDIDTVKSRAAKWVRGPRR